MIYNSQDVIQLRTYISYTKILLEAIKDLDDYGLGTSEFAINELIEKLEFGCDPISRMLHTNYNHIDACAMQDWLKKRFNNLNSLNVDRLISCVKSDNLDNLIRACDVALYI